MICSSLPVVLARVGLESMNQIDKQGRSQSAGHYFKNEEEDGLHEHREPGSSLVFVIRGVNTRGWANFEGTDSKYFRFCHLPRVFVIYICLF